MVTCDYCDGIVDPATKICDDCLYDYSALYESGEYSAD